MQAGIRAGMHYATTTTAATTAPATTTTTTLHYNYHYITLRYATVHYGTLHYTTLIEGSLEVKLPKIWTDEKQSREEAERRGRLEGRRIEEKK